MHAIAAAREGVELRIREEGMSGRKDLPLLRVYISEHAHSSVEKGVITLGLGQRGLRKIPVDKEFRMDSKALSDAIEEDKRNGYVPFCIVATVGTTSTSSIDPVAEMIPIGEKHAMWLHVDAAYAGSAACTGASPYSAGCEGRFRSVNPHNWLFTPLIFSFVLPSRISCARFPRSFLIPENAGAEKVRADRIMEFNWARVSRLTVDDHSFFGHEALAAHPSIAAAKLFASW